MKRIQKRRTRCRGGFTLLEVLLVLMILIILSSTVSFGVLRAQKTANINAARAQMGLFKGMLTAYALEVGTYPTSEQGLAALRVQPEGVTKWNGPYADNDIPADPWLSPYQYACSGEDYQIWSWGPDRQDGTADDVRL